MKYVAILTSLLFVACGESSTDALSEEISQAVDKEVQESPTSEIPAVTDDGESSLSYSLDAIADAPECDSETRGQLVYALDTETFYTCAETEWVAISIAGKDGEDGQDGQDAPAVSPIKRVFLMTESGDMCLGFEYASCAIKGGSVVEYSDGTWQVSAEVREVYYDGQAYDTATYPVHLNVPNNWTSSVSSHGLLKIDSRGYFPVLLITVPKEFLVLFVLDLNQNGTYEQDEDFVIFTPRLELISE